jgi:hypothetical protein
MKITKSIFNFFLICICLSCKDFKFNRNENKTDLIKKVRTERENNQKSKNDDLDWKLTSYGLWKSKNGDLAIKAKEEIGEGEYIDRYITHICCEGDEIIKIIDTLTFQDLGNSFYKDKNNVYAHFEMSDGGTFSIVENADLETFEVIGSCYAKDKKTIYALGAREMNNIDYRTFKTCNDCGCISKDKNGYYFWDEKTDTIGIAIQVLKKLKKL